MRKENEMLRGKIKAANLEIVRMHKEVLRAKESAAAAVNEVGQISGALYIGATLRFVKATQDGGMEAEFPYIDLQATGKYDMQIKRDDGNRVFTVRVRERGAQDGHA